MELNDITPAIVTGVFTLLGATLGFLGNALYQNHVNKPKLEVHTVQSKSAWHYTIPQGEMTKHVFLAYISIVNKGLKDVSVASTKLSILETENRSDVQMSPMQELNTIGNRIIPLSIMNSDKAMIKSGQLVNYLVGFESGLGDEPMSFIGDLSITDAFGKVVKPIRIEFEDIPYINMEAILSNTILEDSLIPNRLKLAISWDDAHYTVRNAEYTFYIMGLTVANRGNHEVNISSIPRLMILDADTEWCLPPPRTISNPKQLTMSKSRLADTPSISLRSGNLTSGDISYTYIVDRCPPPLIKSNRIHGSIIIYDGYNNEVGEDIDFRLLWVQPSTDVSSPREGL